MLTQLSIRNIILIQQLDIELGAGMCVLTGETGAGKSILLDALGFAIGERASAKLLRPGEEKGSVTASFNIKAQPQLIAMLQSQDISVEGNELIIRRSIDTLGKSKAYMNDQPVTGQFLKTVGEQLIEVHGQHDQRGLLDSKTNRHVLDRYGCLDALLKETFLAYQVYHNTKVRKDELLALHAKAEQEQDYIKYVCQELDALDLGVDEELLAQQRQRLMHQEKIIYGLGNAYELLSGSTPLERNIVGAQSELQKLIDMEPQCKTIIETLERAAIELNEAEQSLNLLMHQRPQDAGSLEKIEQSLFALRGASRKYHVPTNQLGEFREQMQRKLDQLENFDISLMEIEQALQEAKKHYMEVTGILSKQRHEAATRLETKIMSELKGLKMDSTIFKVQVEPLSENDWSNEGRDRIIFLASTNPGSPLAPLAKIASGGELSRFMLAMKVALSGIKSTPTLIFDEIDTGIGGATADAVGNRLKTLAQHVQILVVTHQPQVASKGNIHFKISKDQHANATFTKVAPLCSEERQEEIARMLAGQDITSEARAAAEQLLAVS
jgi:DNA repair protein RecN (Recombination protein N)